MTRAPRNWLLVAAYLGLISLVAWPSAEYVHERSLLAEMDNHAEELHFHSRLPSESYQKHAMSRLQATVAERYPDDLVESLLVRARGQSIPGLYVLWALPLLTLLFWSGSRTQGAAPSLRRAAGHWVGAALALNAVTACVVVFTGEAAFFGAMSTAAQFALAWSLAGVAYLASYAAAETSVPRRAWARLALIIGFWWLMFTVRQFACLANSAMQFAFPASADRFVLSQKPSEVAIGLVIFAAWIGGFSLRVVRRGSAVSEGLGVVQDALIDTSVRSSRQHA